MSGTVMSLIWIPLMILHRWKKSHLALYSPEVDDLIYSIMAVDTLSENPFFVRKLPILSMCEAGGCGCFCGICLTWVHTGDASSPEVSVEDLPGGPLMLEPNSPMAMPAQPE